ncbi:MAG: DUF481 domain-containing protein, partial [Myxococcota bacterium]|nr:DUF481 domain-containing protein [Myxococcota bacterium]
MPDSPQLMPCRSPKLLAIALGSLVFFAPLAAQAEDKTAPATAKAPVQERFLLSNGDWMSGSFESLDDHEIKFEGVHVDKIDLGDLTLAFGDIVELQFGSENTFVFPNQKKVVGVAKVSGDTLTIVTDDGTQHFPRIDLVSIAKGRISEIDLWSGGASIGLTKNSGNSDELQLLVLAHLVRQGETVRFRTHYLNNLSKNKGVPTVNNQRLDSRIDVFIGERLYVTPAILDYYSDAFQNIDWRLSPGAGAGYQVVQGKRAEWDIDMALVYQQTRYTPPLGQDNAVALKLQTHFRVKFTDYLRLNGNYSIVADLEDTANVTQHSLVKLDVGIT